MAVLLIVAGFFAVKPVRNAIRGAQARRHARNAFALIDQQKWQEARDEATAAYQLRPNEPEALRAVARLLSRAGQADAIAFWKSLAAETTLTQDDLRDEAAIALKANDLAVAEEATQRLIESHAKQSEPHDFILAVEVSLRKRRFDQASELAKKVLADPSATRRDQLQAALALETILQNDNASLVGDPKQIDARLAKIADGNDDASLEALVALAQHIANPAPETKDLPPPIPVDDLIAKIDNHPLAKPQHKLFAAELAMSRHPDQRDAIEQRTIDRWKNGSNDELAALAGWLYRRGDYERELKAVPLERATQTRELFLQRVDALGALNRWDEIRKILESERYPLDPVIQN